MCVNTTRLDHFSEVSQANVSDYLKRDYPIIVTDAMDTWPALQMFSVAFIADVCMYALCIVDLRVALNL